MATIKRSGQKVESLRPKFVGGIGDGSYSHFNLGKENGDGAAEWSAPSSFLATNRMGAGIERRLEFF